MNKELLKLSKRLKIGLNVFTSGCLFWIAETIFFLIYSGWHWTATHPAEKLCDEIAGNVIVFSLLWVIVITAEGMIRLVAAIKKAVEED